MNTEEKILKTINRRNLIDIVTEAIVLKAKLKIEKAQVSWLDRLADELRDGEDDDESSELYKEYKELKKRLERELLDNYGIELHRY